MANNTQNELLEIYKLHSELADRISQRREGANRLFVSLLVGLAVVSATMLRFGIGDTPVQLATLVLGLLGISLSASWFIVIRSYRQINSAKFRVLHELERKLAFQFFIDEWDPKAEGKKTNKYWRLTVVEQSLPIIFSMLFCGLTIYSFCV